jgi:hypothetical protein
MTMGEAKQLITMSLADFLGQGSISEQLLAAPTAAMGALRLSPRSSPRGTLSPEEITEDLCILLGVDDADCIASAIEEDEDDFFQYLADLGEPSLIREYLYCATDQGHEYTVESARCACRAGRIVYEVLAQVVEFPPLRLIDDVVCSGELDFAKQMANLPQNEPNYDTLIAAVMASCQDIVSWLLTLLPPTEKVLCHAVSHGLYDMVTLLIEKECPWSEKVMIAAVAYPDICELLRTTKHPRTGKYCPWSEKVLDRADEGGFHDTVAWLVKKKCPGHQDYRADC